MNYEEELNNWIQALESIEKNSAFIFKKTRDKHHVSIKKFAKDLKISELWIFQIEEGHSLPNIKTIRKLLKWVKENDP